MFADALSITISDADHSEDEERWEAMSVSNRQRLLVVVHIEEEANPYHLDGNKRTGHAAMEVLLHGFENQSSVDEQEKIILQWHSGEMDRQALMLWLRDHVFWHGLER